MIVNPDGDTKVITSLNHFPQDLHGYVIRLATTEKKTDVTKRGNREQATVSWENEKRGTNRNLNPSHFVPIVFIFQFAGRSRF